MSSAGHPEKSTSFCAQGAHGVVEEIENCRVTKKCWCHGMYRLWEQRERQGTKPVWEFNRAVPRGTDVRAGF